ncbi:hypothetical protein [Acidovorax sp. LjRoot117]|uniref:hypothetical protein n=1 Tax=Acidovorax sp. LjRoot117 TaxID=3342255 RepID=UPI003ED09868
MQTTTFAYRISASLALAFALTAAATATAAEPATAAAPPSQPNPYPAIDPEFSRPDPRRMPSRTTLRSYLAEEEANGYLNTFCFVQQAFKAEGAGDSDETLLWMIWHEGAYLQQINSVKDGQRYRSDPALDPVTAGHALAYASGGINLKTGVVPTDEDIGTSTFLVSRPWVNHKLAQCQRVGVQVRIPAFKPAKSAQ